MSRVNRNLKDNEGSKAVSKLQAMISDIIVNDRHTTHHQCMIRKKNIALDQSVPYLKGTPGLNLINRSLRVAMAHTCAIWKKRGCGRWTNCVDTFSILVSILCRNTKRQGTNNRGAKREYNVNMDRECVYAICTHINLPMHKSATPSSGLNLLDCR